MKSNTLKTLTGAFDTSKHSITISDMRTKDQPLIYCNAGFERFSGYTREEAIGRNCRFLQIGNSNLEACRQIRQAIAARESVIVNLRNARKNGKTLHNQLSLRPIISRSGVLVFYIGIQTDVTEMRTLEENLVSYITDQVKSIV